LKGSFVERPGNGERRHKRRWAPLESGPDEGEEEMTDAAMTGAAERRLVGPEER